MNVHREAALVYVGLGLAVVGITLAGGLVPPERQGATFELAIGAAFVILFGWIVSRGWWLVTAALVVSNAWRSFTFANHAFGRHLELRPLRTIEVEPEPLALVNAALMAVVVGFLARSAWHGARNRREEAR